LRVRPFDSNYYDLGTYCRYSQLDGLLLEVNHMFKHIKLGFGQGSDHICFDIRAGIITREEGIRLLKEFDGRCGEQYIKRFCNSMEISQDEFWRVANSFRGKMWENDKNGEWKLKNPIWEQEPVREDIDLNQVINKINSHLEN